MVCVKHQILIWTTIIPITGRYVTLYPIIRSKHCRRSARRTFLCVEQ